jgi:hypothetical protein
MVTRRAAEMEARSASNRSISVQVHTKYEPVMNLKTPGFTMPRGLVLAADEVIKLMMQFAGC